MLSLPSEVSFQSNHQINYFVSDSHRQNVLRETKVGNFEILQSKRVQWSNGTFDTSSNFEKRHPSNVRPQWKLIPHCEFCNPTELNNYSIENKVYFDLNFSSI